MIAALARVTWHGYDRGGGPARCRRRGAGDLVGGPVTVTVTVGAGAGRSESACQCQTASEPVAWYRDRDAWRRGSRTSLRTIVQAGNLRLPGRLGRHRAHRDSGWRTSQVEAPAAAAAAQHASLELCDRDSQLGKVSFNPGKVLPVVATVRIMSRAARWDPGAAGPRAGTGETEGD